MHAEQNLMIMSIMECGKVVVKSSYTMEKRVLFSFISISLISVYGFVRVFFDPYFFEPILFNTGFSIYMAISTR